MSGTSPWKWSRSVMPDSVGQNRLSRRQIFFAGLVAAPATTIPAAGLARVSPDLILAELPGAALSVESVDALLLAEKPTGLALAQGLHAPGDGGGGLFRWDPGSRQAPDGGTVFEQARGEPRVGRWIRDFTGVVNVRWFGAKGDWNGRNGSDDTAAIQRALDSGHPVRVPAGSFRITSTLHADHGLQGDDPRFSRLIVDFAGYALKPRSGPADHFLVTGLGFHGTRPDSASAVASGVDLGHGTGAHNWRVTNVVFYRLVQAIFAESSYIGKIEDAYVIDCGTPQVFAIHVTDSPAAESNAVHGDNVQIRSLDGSWIGRGLRVDRAYDSTWRNLGVEHVTADIGALFTGSGRATTILGGYWEVHPDKRRDINRVIFEGSANLTGVLVNCDLEVRDETVVFHSCRFLLDPRMSGSMALQSTQLADPRFAIVLSPSGGRRLPRYEMRAPVPAALPGLVVGGQLRRSRVNFRGLPLGPVAATSLGLVEDQGGSHALSIVGSVGLFQPAMLECVVTSGVMSAVGLPFFVPPGVAAEVYAWAIVAQGGGGKVSLSLGGPNFEQSGKDVAVPGVTDWMLLVVGPVSPYNGTAWLTLNAREAGPPPVGTFFRLDSWGISFGGVTYASIGAEA